MAVSRANERNILTSEQFDLVNQTYHPAIYHVDAKVLHELQRKIRDQRDKLNTQVRQRQREARGRAKHRGRHFPATTDQPLKRKQMLASALKRVNREIERLRVIKQTAHVDAARRALALHRSANFEHAPVADHRTANEGMRPHSGPRRRKIIPGSQIGSVSQATKVAQAIKDHRGL